MEQHVNERRVMVAAAVAGLFSASICAAAPARAEASAYPTKPVRMIVPL